MPSLSGLAAFVRKYAGAAKTVAASVLNVVAPGSQSLIELVGQSCDTAKEIADVVGDPSEEKLLALVQNNTAELERIGRLMDLLTTDLARVCDKTHEMAEVFADDPDELEKIVRRVLAADTTLTDSLKKLDAITSSFDCLASEQKRLADGQDELIPIIRRMTLVAEYFEECVRAGLKPKDFVKSLQNRQQVIEKIHTGDTGDTGDLDNLLLEMRSQTPRAASVPLLEAGVAVVERNYPAVQEAVHTAVKLKPNDTGLRELHRKATVVATRVVTPFTKKPTNSPLPRRLQVGDTLDGFLREQRLGAGGWGQVFKAIKNGKFYAIKIVHPEYAEETSITEQFRREIGNLHQLPQHDNLVKIDRDSGGFNFLRDQNGLYLVMEFIDGPTLEQYLQQNGPLTVEQIRGWFGDLADGLGKAHLLGMCHRDIKPGNLILCRRTNKLKLVDFGLAALASELGQTKIGGISVSFASPEQHHGEPADSRSDVYSLAATINYAYFFKQPELRLPFRFTPEKLPTELREPLQIAMKPNPDSRYKNAEEFRRAMLASPQPAKNPEPNRVEATPSSPKVGSLITNSLGMKFAFVPAGIGWLGGGGGKQATTKFEAEEAFYCGIYPVTQGEWQSIMGGNPAHFSRKNKGADKVKGVSDADLARFPIETVNWHQALEFIDHLNTKHPLDGFLYRLPTEQEWEYICRGGCVSQKDSAFHYYLAKPTDTLSPTQANIANSLDRTSRVGLYKPNPLGIYDFHGNVWEWTASSEGSDRVLRGGSWLNPAERCTAAFRIRLDPGYADFSLGFRFLAVPSS